MSHWLICQHIARRPARRIFIYTLLSRRTRQRATSMTARDILTALCGFLLCNMFFLLTVFFAAALTN